MKNLFNKSESLYLKAVSVVTTLQNAGYTSYFAGGAVRDALLGIKPKDYDIATEATPEQVTALFSNADPIGAHFGVILVKNEKEPFEVATFRTDGEYTDSRRPESVTYSSPKEDAERRDFTINGLFYDPTKEEIIDFVDGSKDLKSKTIKAIGDPNARFKEDALRLMRCIRFAVKTNFTIEKDTFKAIKENAHLLENISKERIQMEFSKIITHKNRKLGLQLLMDTNLIEFIIPQVKNLVGCEQPKIHHPEGDVYNHTSIALDHLPEDASLKLCLAVLLHDIGKPGTYTHDKELNKISFNGHEKLGATMTEDILTTLKYPNEIIQDTATMVANHMKFLSVKNMKNSTIRKFISRNTFKDELELHKVDSSSSNKDFSNLEFIQEKQKEFANKPLIPEKFITGKDLIKLGFSPSPKFKKIIAIVQNKQLNNEINSKKEALSYVKDHFKQQALKI